MRGSIRTSPTTRTRIATRTGSSRSTGAVATLALDVDEDRGIKPGYKLKLNSYDLGVDIELARCAAAHPLRASRGRERRRHQRRASASSAPAPTSSCSALSSHAWKVNFCKFTNETRNGIEDSSRHSGLKFVAACNGTTAGGGYELALACDEILLIDDRSSAVSLPEVPLLGVLPGTGGLTRLTDKRKVRRDHADVFCTLVEGVRAQRAKEWRLSTMPRSRSSSPTRCASARARSPRRATGRGDATGVALPPLARTIDDTGIHYGMSTSRSIAGRAPRRSPFRRRARRCPPSSTRILAAGAAWWPLAMARELDDAILLLRTNELEIGTWILKTARRRRRRCSPPTLRCRRIAPNWFVRETIGMLRRTLARLDVTSRTLYALDRAGLVLRRDALRAGARRRPQLHALAARRRAQRRRRIALSAMNFGAYPMVNGLTRDRDAVLRRAGATDRAAHGPPRIACSPPTTPSTLGLVTAAPDDLDWADEIRIALEERASLSPDALTGMEANLRFARRGDDGDARLRPALGLAELDLHPPERRRRSRRAEDLRHRQQGEVQLGAGIAVIPEHAGIQRLSHESRRVPAPAGATTKSEH